MLFNRKCEVIVNTEPALVFSDQKIAFDLLKSHDYSENLAKVEIHNLNRATRKIIAEEAKHITLKAGYDTLIEIGNGDITNIQNNRDTTEVVTEIAIASGLDTVQAQVITISLSEKKSVKLRDVIAHLEQNYSLAFNVASIDDSISLIGGYVDFGSLTQVMNNLSLQFKTKWSMQNQTISVVGDNHKNSYVVASFTTDSGLILHPDTLQNVSREVTTMNMFPVRTALFLMQPQLQVHDVISISSEELDGKFRIQKLAHKGDNRGKEWYTAVELEELN